jgi:methionyl-tRNA formyltransferase
MRLVFCGTPEFAVPCLDALLEHGHEVALVLTQPDRPAGRKMELQQPVVKRVALERGLRVQQPEKIKTNEALRSELGSILPDAIIVVAYGRIIPAWMLELPRFGNLNLHGSLLPKYRGAAPIQWAVANGETETGVTTMRLDAGLDTGDVLLERRVPIGSETTATELYPRLAGLGAELMAETLDGLERGTLTPRVQDHARASLAPILTREDGRMDLQERPARVVYNRWRGFSPWPGAYGVFRGKRFLVHRMHLPQAGAPILRAGELAAVGDDLLAGAAEGTAVVFDEVQMEGKPRLTGAAFARDFQVRAGEFLA